jgi:hypothetical protein
MKIEKNKIEIIHSNGLIHKDDSISTIKKKIINEIGLNEISYDEIYLFVNTQQMMNPINIYKSVTKNDENPMNDEKIQQLFLNMNATPSCYQASNANGSVISTYIGALHAETHDAAQVVFYANLQDNPDVFFNSLPTSGPIRVTVFRANFTTPFTTVTTAQNLANYVMVLCFEQVGKIDGYNI